MGADPEVMTAMPARYELEVQPESIPGLLERFDLVIGEPG